MCTWHHAAKTPGKVFNGVTSQEPWDMCTSEQLHRARLHFNKTWGMKSNQAKI